MQRGFRFLMLIILLMTSIVGCGGEANLNSATESPTAAKEAAAKMPPPPGMKTRTPKGN